MEYQYAVADGEHFHVLLDVQLGHRWCILFVSPQAGHLQSDVTSFSAFPAICLCLFFICDVFFFGTAFNIPSQIPSRIDGNDGSPSWKDTGTASAKDGRKGRDTWRYWTCGILYAESTAGERSRGRKEAPEKAILTDGVANAIVVELSQVYCPNRHRRPPVAPLMPGPGVFVVRGFQAV